MTVFMRTIILLLAISAPVHAADVTTKQLQAIMTHLPDERATSFLKPLNDAMREFDINTPKRQAAFLAQIAHESGQLKYMEEIASGEAYEGRKGLGNTEPGDGKRYKGRGPIQLTGRNNYRKAGAALKLDLEGKPELAAQPDIGCRVAGWFWKTHGLNDLADKGDFQMITKRVNGGTNGRASRDAYFKRAKEALGVKD
jgi:predicted chitinase